MFAVWALPIGLACGAGQYLITRYVARNICRGKQRPFISGLLVGAKLLITFGVLFGLAFISIYHMLWAAGGILGISIAGAIYDFVKVRIPKIR
jgi:hypothetical protein